MVGIVEALWKLESSFVKKNIIELGLSIGALVSCDSNDFTVDKCRKNMADFDCIPLLVTAESHDRFMSAPNAQYTTTGWVK